MKSNKNIGILAIEVYVPQLYVSQEKLEEFDSAGKGKYTIGLMQSKMSFCSEIEDINSISLTAVNQLMKKNGINYKDIGRLEVGTETVIDKSKSVKTTLMQLFDESGNHDIEGIDCINACYGGTAAFFNSVAWCESSAWDGRLALVVAADIAVYEKGPARPTGGAGAVAILIGPNAPIVLENSSGLRGSYFQNAYDFFKPNLDSEYPVVDGLLSIKCYFNALDNCYSKFRKNVENFSLSKIKDDPKEKDNANNPLQNTRKFTSDSIDYCVFHSPYNKLVLKSWARIHYLDFCYFPENLISEKNLDLQFLKKFLDLKLEDTYFNREIEDNFKKISHESYNKKVDPSTLISNNCGNLYCGSLYGGLASLIFNTNSKDLIGKRIVMFSYGSGLASSMFSLLVREDPTEIKKNLDIQNLLDQRIEILPNQFTDILEQRKNNYNKKDIKPKPLEIETLKSNVFYLKEIDSMGRRFYFQKD
ncbi:hydroxymethylglutaryl-coa synthase [Anaeramoeba ignava]|uniref:Hydroxymethylglutaryl-CoA synthase n=1 Tax=Anaeramoeba ignava TaxID=1746090 RepID=A0A9Q0LFJ8_ANAIG|nr:hydroxymethylglutaryl-coa synthase [Anaeramoeba ignava]